MNHYLLTEKSSLFSSPEVIAKACFSDHLLSVYNLVKFSFNGEISTKLGKKHSWEKVIQVCLNEGACPIPKEDNNEITKYIDKM